MYFEKKVQTSIGKYHVEIRVDREVGKYEVRVIKDPPIRYVFGVPVAKEPLIMRRFPLEKPFTDAIEELVIEWERPIRYANELKEWDGIIREETEDLTETNQTNENQTETTEKERIITITDFEDPEPEIIRFSEEERIIPVKDFYNPDQKYIKLKKRKTS